MSIMFLIFVKASVKFSGVSDFAHREEKKKPKPEGCDAEEKTNISPGGPAPDQGPKGAGGPSVGPAGGLSQQPLKRGQKVRKREVWKSLLS